MLQDAQAKKAKRKSASGQQKEAEAKKAKRQAETEEEKESRMLQDAQAKKAKRESASEKQKEAEAKRAKCRICNKCSSTVDEIDALVGTCSKCTLIQRLARSGR